MFAQKKTQQFLELHHLRDRNQFALDPHQIGVRIAHHRHQFLDVNQSNRVVEILAAKRKPRVPRFDRLLRVRFEVVFQIEINNFAAWRHDIAHDALAQIKHIEHELSAERRNFLRLFALFDNEP